MWRDSGEIVDGGSCAIASNGQDGAPWLDDDVLVIPVTAGQTPDRPAMDCGDAIVQALQSTEAGGRVDRGVGHDLITGEAALDAAQRHGGRGNDTAANHKRQLDLFPKGGPGFRRGGTADPQMEAARRHPCVAVIAPLSAARAQDLASSEIFK